MNDFLSGNAAPAATAVATSAAQATSTAHAAAKLPAGYAQHHGQTPE